jgi:hypothetical protein
VSEIGVQSDVANQQEMKTFMSEEKIEACKAIFYAAGIDPV